MTFRDADPDQPAPAGGEDPPSGRVLPDAAATVGVTPTVAGRGPRVVPRRRKRSTLAEIVIVVVLSLALSSLIKTFLVQAFYIPSGSMQNTLAIGDRILVNKLAVRFNDLHRGDVVVFTDPGGWLNDGFVPQRTGVARVVHDALVAVGVLPSDSAGDLVKRVIGVGGDHVVCCDAQGRITVNGTPLVETSYLYPGNAPSRIRFDVHVPPGMLWVMGDHRSVSQDSRFHQGDRYHGMVPVADVVGRAFVIIWPVDRWQLLSRPATFASISP